MMSIKNYQLLKTAYSHLKKQSRSIRILLTEQSLMMNSFQCMNDPLWIINPSDMEQYLISNDPSSEEEKESSPISIVFSFLSPCNFKSFTFFNEPSLTCSSFRSWNLVKSRVTKPASSLVRAVMVKLVKLPGRRANSSRLLTAICDCVTRHTTPTIVVHNSLFLSQTLFEEMLSSFKIRLLSSFRYSYWMHEHNCRTLFPDSMILRNTA